MSEFFLLLLLLSSSLKISPRPLSTSGLENEKKGVETEKTTTTPSTFFFVVSLSISRFLSENIGERQELDVTCALGPDGRFLGVVLTLGRRELLLCALH